METARVLSSPAELAAYLHRTRMMICAALAARAMTSSELGRHLGVHPANLTRHIRVLASAGLIQRVAGGSAVEKRYRAVAARFRIDDRSGEGESAASAALAMVASDLSHALETADSNLETSAAFLARSAIAPERIAAFTMRLHKLAQEFRAEDGAGSVPIHLALAIYPGGAWRDVPERIEIGSMPDGQERKK